LRYYLPPHYFTFRRSHPDQQIFRTCVSYFYSRCSGLKLSTSRAKFLAGGLNTRLKNFNLIEQHNFCGGRRIVVTNSHSSIPGWIWARFDLGHQQKWIGWRHFWKFLRVPSLKLDCFKTLINRWFSIMLLPPP